MRSNELALRVAPLPMTALGLAALPIIWMTATKALTDAPATGFLALELLAATIFREN